MNTTVVMVDAVGRVGFFVSSEGSGDGAQMMETLSEKEWNLTVP